jgi:hypothetical protein
MDPLTLFALANGAVAAVKKGCQLYKDIKSAAGDVKGVLKDLDDQFSKAHPPEKPPSTEQKKQFIEEKNRVIELNKRANESDDVYTEIGEQLGAYFDNYHKCKTILEEEEKRSATEIYTGDASLGKRALQRVLMQRKLEAMGTELQEIMIYQSPPELGALWTDVSAMMKELGEQQRVHITKKMKLDDAAAKRRAARMKKYQFEFMLGLAFLVIMIVIGGLMMWIAHDAQIRWGDSMKNKPYQTRLAELRKQEWFERQKKLKDYQEFLEEKERKRKENEVGD